MEIEGLVVSPLTIKAILRFDVLKEHDTAIDVKSKETLFYTCSCTFPLTEANTPPTNCTHHSHHSHHNIPLNSEVEVMACLSEPVTSGTWFLEEFPEKWHAACIARAVVTL